MGGSPTTWLPKVLSCFLGKIAKFKTKDVDNAIWKAWPDGVVNIPANPETSLSDIYSRLKDRLSQVPGASVKYERAPQGQTNPDEGPCSYWVVFIAPTAELYNFTSDSIRPDEDGVDQPVSGEGWMGCMVAISAIAPFAVVRLDELEVYENGSKMVPEVEPHMCDFDMRPLDMEKHYLEVFDEYGLVVLTELRAAVYRILEELEIPVIPQAELERQAPGLRAGGKLRTMKAGDPVTVQQAFFYEWD